MDIIKANWSNSEHTVKLAFPIAKVNKEKRTVSGFASLDNVDHHGDIVTAEASKKAFENFRGNIREMHGPSAVGKMLSFKEDTFFDPKSSKKYNGVYVEAYISKGAPDAWEKCLDGTYTGFSIGGNIIDAKMEKSADGNEDRRIINNYELHELSLVDSPANPLANIFSIQKADSGETVYKGIVTDIFTENVFWCKSDEVASTTSDDTKACVVCGDSMANIGWVEQTEIEKFESIQKVIDSYFKKDDAPTSAHEATETSSPGMNVIDSTTAINMYPDQGKKKQEVLSSNKTKITKSDESLVEGGNEMNEETNTEVVESTEVEAPAEETTAIVEEAVESTGEAIEKSAEISEVEDTLDFAKMVSDLKTFFGETITKNYSESNASVEAISKLVEETTSGINKAIADLADKYEALTKTVTEVTEKVANVDTKLSTVDSATAVKKSSDLNGSMEGTNPVQKSIWQGHFLGVQGLTK